MEYYSIETAYTTNVFEDLASNKSPKNSSNYTKSSCLESANDDHDQASVVSNSESSSSCATNYTEIPEFQNGFHRIFEGDNIYDVIKTRFLLGLGQLGKQAKVVAIHRNNYSGLMEQAKLQSFQIFSKAMARKCGGNANVKYAWYGGKRDEVSKIMKHGFGSEIVSNNGLYGCGVYLSPDHSPLDCVKNLTVDEDGMRHLLLCRVILGKPEVVPPGSEQSYPSSEEFDSGIDSLSSPKKYIVWSTNINTHVLPEYVISFKAPASLKGFYKIRESMRMPTSPWIPIPTLISVLSKCLPPTAVSSIAKYHKDYKEKKILRQEMIRQVRKIAGDKLLIAIINSFRTKKARPSSSLRQTMAQNGVNCNMSIGNMDELVMHG